MAPLLQTLVLTKIFFLPHDSTVLSGSGTEGNSVIKLYQWRKISGPSQFLITSPAKAQTTLHRLVPGVYEFELKVTDSLGASGKDTVSITVAAAPNDRLTANAGADVTIASPADSALLKGSGSGPNGEEVLFEWKKISGPSQFVISSPNKPRSIVNGLTPGEYEFELIVTDTRGASAKDTMDITVKKANNENPFADAGADKTIVLPTDTVTLQGAGSDPDGKIVGYLWEKISGPACTISNASQAQTTIRNLEKGSYVFELQVKDDRDAVAHDTVTVNVQAAIGDSTGHGYSPNAGAHAFTIKIFPNPVTDNFILELSTYHSGNITIQVINSAGMVVRSFGFDKDLIIDRTHFIIPVKDIPPGVYFVRMQIGDWSETGKIVKL